MAGVPLPVDGAGAAGRGGAVCASVIIDGRREREGTQNQCPGHARIIGQAREARVMAANGG